MKSDELEKVREKLRSQIVEIVGEDRADMVLAACMEALLDLIKGNGYLR